MPPATLHMTIRMHFDHAPAEPSLPSTTALTRNTTAYTIAPQSSPVRRPFFLLQFEALKHAVKHPAHRATVDIALTVFSERSIFVIITEKTKTIVK